MRRLRDPLLRDAATEIPTRPRGRPRKHPDVPSKWVKPPPAELPPIDPQITKTDVERQLAQLENIVSQTLLSGLTPRTAVRLITAEHPNYDHTLVLRVCTGMYAEWEQTFEESVAKERPRQIERLRHDLARMRAVQRPSFQAIRGHEELLGRIMGTLQPIRVQVDVMATLRQSVAVVLQDMTEEEKDQLVAEQLELEAFAGRSLTRLAAE